MKIKQYVYFAIRSEVLLPDEIAERVALEPRSSCASWFADSGSTTPDPGNIWEVRCDEPGLRVDEQIARVMNRLAPARAAMRDLVQTSDQVSAWCQLVRYFGFEDGELLVELEDRPPASLEDLNRVFQSWVEQVYHRRVHTETGVV